MEPIAPLKRLKLKNNIDMVSLVISEFIRYNGMKIVFRRKKHGKDKNDNTIGRDGRR